MSAWCPTTPRTASSDVGASVGCTTGASGATTCCASSACCGGDARGRGRAPAGRRARPRHCCSCAAALGPALLAAPLRTSDTGGGTAARYALALLKPPLPLLVNSPERLPGATSPTSRPRWSTWHAAQAQGAAWPRAAPSWGAPAPSCATDLRSIAAGQLFKRRLGDHPKASRLIKECTRVFCGLKEFVRTIKRDGAREGSAELVPADSRQSRPCGRWVGGRVQSAWRSCEMDENLTEPGLQSMGAAVSSRRLKKRCRKKAAEDGVGTQEDKRG